MAFIVQASQGVIFNANAYITVDYFRDYHETRGNDVDCGSTKTIQGTIIRATDYIDQRFSFIGERLQREQQTQWPRCDAYDIDDYLVNGLPFEVQRATAEYALIALKGEINPTPVREDNGRIISRKFEKVGPLEEETVYDRSIRFEMPRYPKADQLLVRRGLIRDSSRVRRG